MQAVRAEHIMTSKLVTLFREQTLPLADELMKLKNIRHIPVVDEAGHLVGLVTHRDILRARISNLSGLDDDEIAARQTEIVVADIMNVDIWTVAPNTLASTAGKVLLDHRFGCLPVVDDNRLLVGILTEADFLRFAIKALAINDPH